MSTNDKMNTDDLFKKLLPGLVSTIRASTALGNQDVKFHRAMDNDNSTAIDGCSKRLLDSANNILNISNYSRNKKQKKINFKGGELSFEESWKDISNTLDFFFEKVDIALDEESKKRKNLSNKIENNNNQNNKEMIYLENGNDNINNKSTRISKKLEKPQLKFKTKIDNSELSPFRPLLTSKPNALKPFETVFQTFEDANGNQVFPQPYEYEITNQPYPDFILERSEPIHSTPWVSTSAIFVDNTELLSQMIEELKKETIIAVDVEHHDYRTFYGIVCLIQISSRNQDWIIDTLKLREELQNLNIVFTNPKIIKVLHGAFMDIIWLQRDFGIYIVGLFDTYHATKYLQFPKHGLAYLLERFANFKTSKKYQLADWRIRPLPQSMIQYARSDTHFLLYIFDILKNMLLESNDNNMKFVLHDSRQVSIKKYEYENFKIDDNNNNNNNKSYNGKPWIGIMQQYNIQPSKIEVCKALYLWRDKIAREEDESVRYIMPNQLLVSLVSTCPTDISGVLATSNIISNYVRTNAAEIVRLIDDSLKIEPSIPELYPPNNQNNNKESNDISVDIDISNPDLSYINSFKILQKENERELEKAGKLVKYVSKIWTLK